MIGIFLGLMRRIAAGGSGGSTGYLLLTDGSSKLELVAGGFLQLHN